MENDIAIKVENLSKVYKVFDKPIDRLKESLNPFGKRYSKDFYALRDVSFSVAKGESVGIIGKNGSGKSTLLKILTGVLTPTRGKVLVNGRVAALLELGAGFDLEMTGIENIYMNGMVMGYTKKEMDNKLKNILDFADIGDFIYQPVKIYSSGMLVRLAFAVQTEVDPDILIIDEALAVGDVLFQKRCFQKINQLINNGTTLLFVSHDQETVRTMTNKAVFLIQGEVKDIGISSDVVLSYRKFLYNEEKKYWKNITREYYNNKIIEDKFSFGDMDAEVINVKVLNKDNEEQIVFYPKDILKFKILIQINKDLTHLNISLRIRNKEGVKIYSWGTLNQDIELWTKDEKKSTIWDKKFKKSQIIEVVFETNCILGKNLYEIQAIISEENDKFFGAQRILHWKDEAAFFSVNIKKQEYFFGGLCDMNMKANINILENI